MSQIKPEPKSYDPTSAADLLTVTTQVDRSTIYALNEKGENIYSMQVQPGFLIIDGQRVRISDKACEDLAACFQHAIIHCYGLLQKD